MDRHPAPQIRGEARQVGGSPTLSKNLSVGILQIKYIVGNSHNNPEPTPAKMRVQRKEQDNTPARIILCNVRSIYSRTLDMGAGFFCF
jgi:hypothetical protein